MTRFAVQLGLLAVFAAEAYAECFGPPPPVFVQVKILACSSAEGLVQEKIANRQYSERERQSLGISTKSIAIVDLELLADVELIVSRTAKGEDAYKGKISPIRSHGPKRYMMLATTPDSCEKLHKGKTLLAELDAEPFSCCHESHRPGANETVAQCLLGLPRATVSSYALEKLRSAEVRVLPQAAK
jgi:hypothetical protein